MFDHGLFIAYDHGDEIPPGFLRSLREATEIEEITGTEYSKFQNLVGSRIEELTHQLTQKPCLILEYRRDGVIRMTERFERFWKKRDLYWEDAVEPSKKRQKSKTVRAQSPLVISDLREKDDVSSGLLPAQGDRGSKLASMAESALDLFIGPDESDKRQSQEAFASEFMVRGILSIITSVLLISPFYRMWTQISNSIPQLLLRRPAEAFRLATA